MADSAATVRVHCAVDDVHLDVPRAACEHIGFIAELITLGHDEDGDEAGGAYTVYERSEDVQAVLDFVALHMKHPVPHKDLYGPSRLDTAAIEAERLAYDAVEDAASAADAQGSAASGAGVMSAADDAAPVGKRTVLKRYAKVLPATKDLHAWGLPKWTVEWLEDMPTPRMFELVVVAEALGCDAMSSALCAKLAALLTCIPEHVQVELTKDIDVPDNMEDDPDADWSMHEFLGHTDKDRSIYEDDGPEVPHEYKPWPGRVYAHADYWKALRATPSGLFRTIVCMT